MYLELINDPKEFARLVRREVAIINNRTRDSHIGGGYSAVDIMAVLYTRFMNLDRNNLNDPNRNIFILSKGHIATTMFATLAYAGIIPYEDLNLHLTDGNNYAGHTRRYTVPGIEMSAGSLGHGSCVGCGMAYAKKIQNYAGKVFVLLGDGECNEGSVWESVMFATRFCLNNLVLIVDRNHLQAYGSDEQVLNMGDLRVKFEAFGAEAFLINGHDYDEIEKTLRYAINKENNRPTVIVANTIKGKGVSYMENKLEWHFKSPDGELLDIALEELG